MNQSYLGWAGSAARSASSRPGHGVIAVQKQQPVVLRGLQAGVARGGQTAVLPVDDPQAGDLSGKGIAKLARQIGRAVIDKDALPVALPRLLRHV